MPRRIGSPIDPSKSARSSVLDRRLGLGNNLLRMCPVRTTLNGGQGRNRTADASLFRAALYQLSYLAVCANSVLTDRLNVLQRGQLRSGFLLHIAMQTVAVRIHRHDRREILHL